MICHRVPSIDEAHRTLEKLPSDQTHRALESVSRFKKNLAPPDKFSEAGFRKIDHEIWDLRVAVLGEKLAAIRSPEDGKRSPVETY
jgi:beta-N-acetylhexosaminidase